MRPILKPYDTQGSTRYVDVDTTKGVYATSPDKCHISHVVEDSSWESKLAQVLEEMPDVVSYVKNQGLGFSIPYTLNGDERQYYPDCIVRCVIRRKLGSTTRREFASCNILLIDFRA